MTQQEFLLDELQYYTEDTNRRCTNNDSCRYSPKNAEKEGISEGCAIGRHLSPELQEELDTFSFSAISHKEIFEKLPSNLQELGKGFLSSCQSLHDLNENWRINSLSKIGEEILESIIINYNLDKSLFDKYLN